ncbi:hypothetical protein L9F63_018448, partial [Diploptera punctata]
IPAKIIDPLVGAPTKNSSKTIYRPHLNKLNYHSYTSITNSGKYVDKSNRAVKLSFTKKNIALETNCYKMTSHVTN